MIDRPLHKEVSGSQRGNVVTAWPLRSAWEIILNAPSHMLCDKIIVIHVIGGMVLVMLV